MMEKRIFIITFNRGANYGSKLQATALSRFLEGKGYSVSFISQVRVPEMLLKHPSLLFVRLLNKINETKRKKFFTPYPYYISEEREKRLDAYENDNFNSVAITNDKQWKQIVKDGTIFISGSDIIWQPSNGYPAKYFLDYVYYTKLKRFSYASSFGAIELPKKYYHAYRKYLQAFDGVSVREQSSAHKLESIIGRKVYQVVDPTMLLSREQWDVYASRAQFLVNLPQKYILCYFVMNDERYWNYVKKIEEKETLPVVVLPMHHLDEEQPYLVITNGTPYEFISLIKGAEFICTDSFHACVFSTIYEKEFYLLRRFRKDEDLKYDEFLNRYGLEDRRIENENSFNRNSKIDFCRAKTRMEEDRNYSVDYLDMCLDEH